MTGPHFGAGGTTPPGQFFREGSPCLRSAICMCRSRPGTGRSGRSTESRSRSHKGEAVGLVGESGSGKSMTLRAILGVLPPEAKITSGEILLDGVDLTKLPSHALNQIRGPKISMIFQEPMSALNPVMRVGYQIAEGPRLHRGYSKAKAAERALELMRQGRHPRPRAPVPRLSARVLRRHAAARHDRDRAVLRSGDHLVRRAHHRARRDDPGPDPAAAGRAVPGIGCQPDLRHPRPAGRRPDLPAGRGHVRRRAGGDRVPCTRCCSIRATRTRSGWCGRRRMSSTCASRSCRFQARRPAWSSRHRDAASIPDAPSSRRTAGCNRRRCASCQVTARRRACTMSAPRKPLPPIGSRR